MANEILTEIACPNCLTPIDIREHGQHVTCPACASQFLLQGHLCPNCQAYHTDLQGVCRACGTALTRICRKCHTDNWAGDEYCAACGTPMDIFDLIVGAQQEARDQKKVDQIEQIRAMREATEKASRERMQAMEALERERQAEIRRRQAARRQGDRQLMVIGAVLGFFLLVGAVLYLLLAA